MKLQSSKFVFLLLTALLLTALGSAAVSAQDAMTLRMTGLAGPVAEGLQAAISVWNENNPDIQVELEIQADEVNWQATAPTTMFADANGPDLTWWWCSRSFQYKDMIEADLLVALDDLYEAEGWFDAFPQGTLDFTPNPTAASTVSISMSSGRPTSITTRTSSPRWAPKCRQPGKSSTRSRTRFALAAISRWSTSTIGFGQSSAGRADDALLDRRRIPRLYAQRHPGSPDWANEYKWTDAHGVRIFETMKEMVDRGLLADGFAGHTEYGQVTGPLHRWQRRHVADGFLGFRQLGNEVDFDWGYFYYPWYDDDMIEPYGPVGSWIPNCFIVFNRENQEAALKVVSYLGSAAGVETYARASRLRRDVPTSPKRQWRNPDGRVGAASRRCRRHGRALAL